MDKNTDNVILDTLESQHWIMTLPNDWIQKECESEGQLYFENNSGTMGLYILTMVNQKKIYDKLQIDAYLDMEKKHINDMSGYNFQIIENLDIKLDVITGIVDSFDLLKKYRIYIKYLARQNAFVRFSFHDYDYETENPVNQITDLIINSIQLKQDFLINN